ncbi:Acetyltransferase (GNAT) domain protein [Meiothermus luteus]|jgi:GNAT superfamily N-acetyltransferase|uniref:Acetyltransferase (GNAT) domain protein n=1 Tax=Meiothermus luteus TaxID=2026184 RepID=A0A399E931_9DEIN|nr:GNAT family N-acetyltransferase [Meiothermus luteus]RIH81227.1 Acetyltransferase (GNAT) domain protein [Meiothermus luteus]
MIEAPYRIEPLGSHHDRAAFTCGKPELDRYLREVVSQDRRLSLSRCFVLVHQDEPARILGYYTLSNAALRPEAAPGKLARVRRYDQIGALLLGRFALDINQQGRGLGRRMLLHMLQHAARLEEESGFALVLVDSMDKEATTFYRKFGFQPLPGTPQRMYLLLKDLRATLQTFAQQPSCP